MTHEIHYSLDNAVLALENLRNTIRMIGLEEFNELLDSDPELDAKWKEMVYILTEGNEA